MAHMQPFGSQMSEMGHAYSWNNQNEDDHLLLGTVAGYNRMVPLDGIPASSISSMAQSNILSGQNGHSLSTFASEFSNVRSSSSRILQNPHLGPPFSSDSSSRFLSNHILHEPYYNGLTIDNRNNIVTPEINIGATTFKRKHPAMPHTFNRENPSPISGLQWGSIDPNITASGHWSNNSLAAREGIQRNMRSRHNYALPLENVLVGTHSSRNLPHHFHSTVGSSVEGQCSYFPESIAPPRRNVSSGLHLFYNENHAPAGFSVPSGFAENNGAHNISVTQSRNMDAMLPTLHFGSTRGMQIGRSSYDQRPVPPYGPVSNHQNTGFDSVTSEDAGPSRVASIASSGHSHTLPTVGRSERNGRGRNFSSRLQLPYERNACSSWLPESFMMLDEMIIYDASTLIDQHSSMRLDIDDMSYEELLALEESIGNVSTGLSEDSISKCLMEMTYSSSDRQVDDEEKCAVCLEGYCEGEKLGILRCEHDFHASCIKEWLLTKNICPICKASALTETKKEKQAIVL